jgi:hypothetical protein
MKPKKPLPPEVEAEIESYQVSHAPRQVERVPLAVMLPAIVGFLVLCSGLPALFLNPWLGLGILIVLLAIMGLVALVRFLGSR